MYPSPLPYDHGKQTTMEELNEVPPESATKAPKIWRLGKMSGNGYYYQFIDREFDSKDAAKQYLMRKYLSGWKPVGPETYKRELVRGMGFALSRQLRDRIYIAADKDDAAPRLVTVAKLIDRRLKDNGWTRPTEGWLNTPEGQDMLWEAIQISVDLRSLQNGNYFDESRPNTDDYDASQRWISETTERFEQQLIRYCIKMAEVSVAVSVDA